MNEAEYHFKNYGDLGGCDPPRPCGPSSNSMIDVAVVVVEENNRNVVAVAVAVAGAVAVAVVLVVVEGKQ